MKRVNRWCHVLHTEIDILQTNPDGAENAGVPNKNGLNVDFQHEVKWHMQKQENTTKKNRSDALVPCKKRPNKYPFKVSVTLVLRLEEWKE